MKITDRTIGHIPREEPTPFASPSPTYYYRDHLASISAEQVEFLAGHALIYGDVKQPNIMMTYDDGNRGEYIQHLLNVYEQYGATCTFFFCGSGLKRIA